VANPIDRGVRGVDNVMNSLRYIVSNVMCSLCKTAPASTPQTIRIAAIHWVVPRVEIRLEGLFHRRIDTQELPGLRVVVAPYQVDRTRRMGVWVPGAIVQAGDLAADGQGSRLVIRHRGPCRGLDRC